jgi:hypothetical protein
MDQAISMALAARLSLAFVMLLASVRVCANGPPWVPDADPATGGPSASPAPGEPVPPGQVDRLATRWWLTAWLGPADAADQLVAAIVAASANAVAFAAIVSLNLDIGVRSRTRDVDTACFRPGTDIWPVLNVHLDCVRDWREFKATNQLRSVTFSRMQGAFRSAYYALLT